MTYSPALYSIALAVFGAAAVVLACGVAAQGAEKSGPKNGAGKKIVAKNPNEVERHIPYWNAIQNGTGAGQGAGKDAAKPKGPATVFDDFKVTAVNRCKKPLVIYFYWPATDAADPAAKECGKFETALMNAAECAKALKDFACYKSDAKKLDKELRKKYAAKVPALLVCDASGKVVKTVTNFPGSEKSLALQLAEIKKNSDKACEKSGSDAKQLDPSKQGGAKQLDPKQGGAVQGETKQGGAKQGGAAKNETRPQKTKGARK